MSRYEILAGLVMIASCASAGSEGPVDGPGADARPPLDAAIPIDAPVDVCPSAATCQTAMMLGQVSGDTVNQRLMTSGYQSAWIRTRVTEDDNDVPGLTLRVAAKLTSPPGVEFDVFVYVNAGSDVVECTTTTGTKTTNGSLKQVRAEWGEGIIPNGVNDSRNVSIEIRPISGTCAPNLMWQLEVEGNWN